jgi:hypothetical protein
MTVVRWQQREYGPHYAGTRDGLVGLNVEVPAIAIDSVRCECRSSIFKVDDAQYYPILGHLQAVQPSRLLHGRRRSSASSTIYTCGP